MTWPMFRWTTLILLACAFASFALTEQDYLKAEAQPGDGVYSLLRRFDLDKHSCNHSQFYKINKLKSDAILKVGKSYSLPIILYKFNGKTIRSSIGSENWNVAKSIEIYNDNMLRDGYRNTDFRKDKILWVPYHLLNCPAEDINTPALPNENGEANLAVEPAGPRIFPIFGKKYEHVPLAGDELRGNVYFIESGHGGPDPGAMVKLGSHTLCEDEYAYDVALRLVRNLVAHGATAYMITRDPDDGIRDDKYLKCDSDEVVWGNKPIKVRQKPRLFQRSDVINELYDKHEKQGVTVQKLIIIHVDSRARGNQTDLYFYYHPDDPQGKKLATELYKSVEANYKKYRNGRGYDGSVTSRDLHMLRESKVPSAYVELGNIKHPQDQQRLIIASNRQLLADWLFEGLK
ncbi:MAG: N-acetylmuramoyl-L-alanine amidase [Saprospiraceae bacterium]|nr:MAG: N-acetylmuramoyl-L-alanine amidase [Saprospiraceae bacterium]